jgi:hypothetical protein
MISSLVEEAHKDVCAFCPLKERLAVAGTVSSPMMESMARRDVSVGRKEPRSSRFEVMLLRRNAYSYLAIWKTGNAHDSFSLFLGNKFYNEIVLGDDHDKITQMLNNDDKVLHLLLTGIPNNQKSIKKSLHIIGAVSFYVEIEGSFVSWIAVSMATYNYNN